MSKIFHILIAYARDTDLNRSSSLALYINGVTTALLYLVFAK